MAKVAQSLFGGGQDAQLAQVRAAQADHAAALAAQKRNTSAIEAGQAHVRSGGGRGFLAYVEEQLGATFG